VNPRLSLALRRRAAQSVPPAQLASELDLAPADLAHELQVLAARGFEIESHPILGLRLLSAPPALDAAEIAHGLGSRRVGPRVRCVETAGSTSDLAWEAAGQGRDAADGLAIFANHQTAGRGRRGNRWLSPPGASVLGSVLLWLDHAAARGGDLTRAAAVAAAEAVEDLTPVSVGIRWPNDLVIDDRKLGGILVEARPGPRDTGPVVLGIGINCLQRQQAFPPSLRPHVVSLAMLGHAVDRTLLARRLLERLDGVCAGLRTPALIERARRRCRTLGRRIIVEEQGTRATGEVADLDPDYGLVLRLDDGGLRRFPALTTHVVGPEAGMGPTRK